MENNESLFSSNRERWKLSHVDAEKINEFASQLDLDPLLAKILLSRNIEGGDLEKINYFINPPENLVSDFKDVTESGHLERAIARIKKALEKKEKLLINGDPDADGISGTTILTAGLRHFGFQVDYAFPIRSREGHGIQSRIVDQAKSDNISLIITTDCGSKDLDAVQYAKEQGVDVIITDHHILGKKLPDALAIVNPQLVKAPTLYKTLSGAGVAFKFILALEQALDRPLPDSIVDFMLTIVAFGTLSDRMSMLNPMNRILVKRGVDALAVSKREGLKSLVRICVEMQGRLMPRMLSRTIIPRLNAPGRIGDPEKGIPDSSIVVDLLLTGIGRKNAKKASSIASIFQSVITLDKKVKEGLDTDSVAQAMTTALSVDDINEKRKFITNKIEEDIEHCIETQVDVMADRIIMVEGKGWNPGVIGIDTDRLKDRFLRPAVIFTFDEKSDYVRASIRSIPTIDMYGMIDAIDDAYQAKHGVSLFNVTVQTTQGERVICAFGGHSQACGLTIHKDKVPEFKALLRESAATLPTEIFNYYYDVIDKIPFSDLTEKFVTKLDAFAPYGQHFDYPIFYLQGCDLSKGKPFGNKYQDLRKPHVRFSVQEKSSKRKKRIRSIPAVGFGLWEKLCELRANHNSDVGFDLIFVCETMYKRKTNEYSVRLNVLDIRHSGQDNLSSH